MQRPDSRILIAGAAWRVWRFIVPALLAAGYLRESVTILRRSTEAELHPGLEGIRVVTSLDALEGERFDMTMNCTAAAAMLDVQEGLVRRFPHARHFCDTPTFSDPADAVRALRLGLKRMHSLEDWPLMPNLAYFAARMRKSRNRAELRIEHFGILTHFLSLYRTIHGDWHPFSRGLVRSEGLVSASPARGRSVLFRYRKNLPLAKLALQTTDCLLEDFHEVEPSPHNDPEVFYRVATEGQVSYLQGATTISSTPIEAVWIRSFEPFSDRKNVHELDKFIGLVRLFRAIAAGGAARPYGYLASVRDNLTSLKLSSGERSLLL
ncbi:hypothetical protein [Kaistia terrae]|uniref:Uncharacterized protein n=1 Tax=Kaistia terrae TaxID=537017 RepID=A0ABW0Q173_9HYPH|nr:hypothetical protein [Kaistia terrae]MCX5578954.1 hypothetical protein [Kaistia terrae]